MRSCITRVEPCTEGGAIGNGGVPGSVTEGGGGGLYALVKVRASLHPGGQPGADLKSISHRWHSNLVDFVWESPKETIKLPLGCLQGGDPAPLLVVST